MYAYYTQGSGRSKFTVPFIEKTLPVRATARNWNSVTKIPDRPEEFFVVIIWEPPAYLYQEASWPKSAT